MTVSKNNPDCSTGNYSNFQGEALLRLARSAIAEKLDLNTELKSTSEILKELDDDTYNRKTGTFVTIHRNKRLRGCIGTLESSEKVKDGIKRNAISAAFQDPRFSPLNSGEFDEIELEISILSEPLKLEYSSHEELLSKLMPGVHGVIIKKGGYRATFLPQVWDQLPDKNLFMSNLCRKAGLPDNEWKKGKLEVSLYTVQHFQE